MDKSKKAFIKGGLIGAAAGAVAGILLAPKSGKETRKDIKDAAAKAMAKADKQLKKLHGELGDYVEKAKAQAKSATGQAKKELEALARAADIAREKAKEAITQIREGEADSKVIQQTIKTAEAALRKISKKVK